MDISSGLSKCLERLGLGCIHAGSWFIDQLVNTILQVAINKEASFIRCTDVNRPVPLQALANKFLCMSLAASSISGTEI